MAPFGRGGSLVLWYPVSLPLAFLMQSERELESRQRIQITHLTCAKRLRIELHINVPETGNVDGTGLVRVK